MIRPITASSLTSTGLTYTSSSGSRATVPVQPSSYIYSHFRHVSGVPAPEGVHGIAVTKLKILDSLIERLAQVRKQQAVETEDSGYKNEKQLDVLINQLQKQVESTAAASAAMPYTPNIQIPAGSFFSIAA